MLQHLRGPAVALGLSILISQPAAAQSLAAGEPAAVRRPELAASYRVRLESAWPQHAGAAECANGGNEIVEGVLTRTEAGDYAGTFTRHTELLFCGTHGAGGEVCSLVLKGEGRVAMRGTVVEGDQLRVAWMPSPAHAAEVHGACGDGFKQRVREMYLSVRHGAEFALPSPGAAPGPERLEDYAWIVEVE